MQILIYNLCFWDVSYCFISFAFDRFDFNRSISFLFYSIFLICFIIYTNKNKAYLLPLPFVNRFVE